MEAAAHRAAAQAELDGPDAALLARYAEAAARRGRASTAAGPGRRPRSADRSAAGQPPPWRVGLCRQTSPQRSRTPDAPLPPPCGQLSSPRRPGAPPRRTLVAARLRAQLRSSPRRRPSSPRSPRRSGGALCAPAELPPPSAAARAVGSLQDAAPASPLRSFMRQGSYSRGAAIPAPAPQAPAAHTSAEARCGAPSALVQSIDASLAELQRSVGSALGVGGGVSPPSYPTRGAVSLRAVSPPRSAAQDCGLRQPAAGAGDLLLAAHAASARLCAEAHAALLAALRRVTDQVSTELAAAAAAVAAAQEAAHAARAAARQPHSPRGRSASPDGGGDSARTLSPRRPAPGLAAAKADELLQSLGTQLREARRYCDAAPASPGRWRGAAHPGGSWSPRRAARPGGPPLSPPAGQGGSALGRGSPRRPGPSPRRALLLSPLPSGLESPRRSGAACAPARQSPRRRPAPPGSPRSAAL
eukprot:TRINITY_DN10684_c1_g1_i2.p1 TRINITY_DN10684_c1_g1~~TRINITY_DN10684_c1_g1_i2.p1  ORF type:complete len:495 (+),score=122.09 TRINITY_DN10684_c1_g1_i2:70-1485(+)